MLGLVRVLVLVIERVWSSQDLALDQVGREWRRIEKAEQEYEDEDEKLLIVVRKTWCVACTKKPPGALRLRSGQASAGSTHAEPLARSAHAHFPFLRRADLHDRTRMP
jgi:hypothetical protein